MRKYLDREGFDREEIEKQLKTEFLSALQPALAKLSAMEIRPNQIIAHNTELEDAMNEALSQKWGATRGLKIVSIALGSVTLPDEDADRIKTMQRNAALVNPNMAGATLVAAQADAMKAAAGNTAGAMTGFMGMGMAQQAGGANAQNLFAMGQQNMAAQAPQAAGWTCSCGTTNTGNFCSNCGSPKPAANWTCSCGTVNSGKFCSNCGSPRG